MAELSGPAGWVVVYPAYLNARKKVSEGRRVPVSKAVDNPTIQDIHNVAKTLGLNCLTEPNKMYPRDVTQAGRVRIDLKSANKENLATKQLLLLALSEGIAKISNKSNSPATTQSQAASKKKKGKK